MTAGSWARCRASARYFAEASQNPLKGSIVYGWGTLTESFKVFLHRAGLGTPRARTS